MTANARKDKTFTESINDGLPIEINHLLDAGIWRYAFRLRERHRFFRRSRLEPDKGFAGSLEDQIFIVLFLMQEAHAKSLAIGRRRHSDVDPSQQPIEWIHRDSSMY